MGKSSGGFDFWQAIILSDAAIIAPPPPPDTGSKTVAKKTAVQRMIAHFELHEAPQMEYIDENDPEHRSSQLGVLGFVHFNLHVSRFRLPKSVYFVQTSTPCRERR